MYTINYVAILTLAIFSLGCRQTANPNMPLAPINPLGGPTRVPPPATGSYATPGGYYQGQATNSGGAALGDLSQFAQSSTATSLTVGNMIATPNLPPATHSDYVGHSTYANNSGYVGNSDHAGNAAYVVDSVYAGNATGYGVSSAAGWSSSNPGGSEAGMAVDGATGAFDSVRPVSHVGASREQSRSDFVTLATPRIPDTARRAIDAAASEIRPSLRGMEVVDLSRSSALRPAEQPQSEPFEEARNLPSTTPAVADARDPEALPWRTPFR